MIMYVVMGTLAAFGGLCLMWLLAFWILGSSDGGMLVCFGHPEQIFSMLTRLMLLRDAGFLRGSIAISASGLRQWEIRRLEEMKIEVIRPEEFALRLKNGVEKSDRTGTGDH